MYTLFLLLLSCGLSVSMVMRGGNPGEPTSSQEHLQEELQAEQQRALEEAPETEELDMSKPESRDQYLRWMQQLLAETQQHEQEKAEEHMNRIQNNHILREILHSKSTPNAQQSSSKYGVHKRFSNTPYLKYKLNKRNNGIWIWMPAQGYVSVPRQQEAGENSVAKPGKIMRYGK